MTATNRIKKMVEGIFDADAKTLIGYTNLDGKEITLNGADGDPLTNGTSINLTGPAGEALKVKQLTELVTIAAAATTESTIEMPAGSIVLAVTSRVTVAIPTATTFDVGDAGDADRFSNDVAVAINTTSKGTLVVPFACAAATKVLITPNGTPATAVGRLRITIFYIEITPPTS